ncbi:glycosyltransferase family 4 protein, partial [Planktotalea sp.]|uniref:glycosyltransferase family 4 protein n=1 Tax=Planktotalea sp. TaxID=2029877 RepID=UPI00329A3C37
TGGAIMSNPRPHLVLLGGDAGPSGVPRHIEQMCQALTNDPAQNYRITVISEPDEGGYSFAKGLGVTHVGLPALSSSLNPFKVFKGWRALHGALRRDPPDVIWAQARLPVLLSRLLPRFGAPLLITFHGSPFLGRSRKSARVMRAIETLLLRATAPLDIVFLSELDRQSFDGLPLARHRCHTIPNVASTLDFPPVAPSDDLRLVMTTRDSPQKNLDAAARIFGALPEKTCLTLLGTGTDSAALKARFAKILPPAALARVTFQGPVSDVTPELRRAHGYLMTSHYEGMSLGALEAFASGLPIFMPDIGGSREILSAHPLAAMIDPRDPIQAAGIMIPKLHSYQNDPIAHSNTISAAYNAHFSPKVWSKQIKDLLESTISGQSQRRSLD